MSGRFHIVTGGPVAGNYELVDVPKLPVEQRADLVLSDIRRNRA